MHGVLLERGCTPKEIKGLTMLSPFDACRALLLDDGARAARRARRFVSESTQVGDWASRPWVGSHHTLRKETAVSKDLSNSKNRDKLKKSSFALPEEEKYPIPDIEHARNALARVAQRGSTAEKKKVRAAVEKKYPSLKKDD